MSLETIDARLASASRSACISIWNSRVFQFGLSILARILVSRIAKKYALSDTVKIAWSERVWVNAHNNIRYQSLLPRTALVATLPRQYVAPSNSHGFGRALRTLKIWWDRDAYEPAHTHALHDRLGFQYLLCTSGSLQQINTFSASIVVDDDDPTFDPYHVSQLNAPQVLAVITPTPRLKDRLLASGLEKPCIVIPSGVEEAFLAVGRQRFATHPSPAPQGERPLTITYAVPELFLDEDFSDQSTEPSQLRSVSFLLRAMEVVWSKNPTVQLRLVGQPSPRLRICSQQYKSVHLVGYRAHHELANEYATADIAVYPRPADMGGRASIKVLECLAAGLPLVCTAASEGRDATSSGAALVANEPQSFGTSILTLVDNYQLRRALGQRGLHYAEDFSWDAIAPIYDAVLYELLSEPTEI